MKERIEWLDLSKGIGIFLVIAGHCLNVNTTPFHLIFEFHMPLFFLLSGYTYSRKTGLGIWLKKKVKGLLFPFFLFYLLGMVATLLLPQWRKNFSLAAVKNDLVFSYPDSVHNSSIWFLVCLFWVCVAYWFISRLYWPVQITILAALYGFGVWFPKSGLTPFGYTRLPLVLDVAPVAITFYALGSYLHSKDWIASIIKSRTKTVAAMLAGAVVGLIVYKYNGYVNLHARSFGNPVLYLLGALSGSAAVVFASGLLAKAQKGIWSEIKRYWIWYGRHSLIILGWQSLLIRLYIEFVNHYYEEQLSLYQFPWKHSIISTIIVAFIVCPTICLCWDKIKQRCVRGKRKAKNEKNTGA